MSLLGPDGKELNKPQEPQARRAPSRQEKFNMVYMMFTLMDRHERQVLIKTLRPLRRELDVKYPLGMTEDDIKRDLEKQAESMGVSDATVPSVPEQENHAEPVNPEVAPSEDVHSEHETNAGSTEGGQVSAS